MAAAAAAAPSKDSTQLWRGRAIAAFYSLRVNTTYSLLHAVLLPLDSIAALARLDVPPARTSIHCGRSENEDDDGEKEVQKNWEEEEEEE